MQNMSDEQIRKAIETFNKKLPLIPEGEDRDLCLVGLENFQNELARRNQKKSESQPTGKTGQLEETEKIKRAVLNPSLGIPSLNETPEKLAADREKQIEQKNKAEWYEERREKAKANEPEKIRELSGSYQGETWVIGTIEDPTPAPVPYVIIGFKTKEGKTEIRRLTQTNILTLLKTYFKRVATSAKMESKRYSEAYDSDMGKTVYKLFQGWNMIYNETKEGAAWPPLADVFPGFARASQQQKVNAEILWRWASNDK